MSSVEPPPLIRDGAGELVSLDREAFQLRLDVVGGVLGGGALGVRHEAPVDHVVQDLAACRHITRDRPCRSRPLTRRYSGQGIEQIELRGGTRAPVAVIVGGHGREGEVIGFDDATRRHRAMKRGQDEPASAVRLDIGASLAKPIALIKVARTRRPRSIFRNARDQMNRTGHG